MLKLLIPMAVAALFVHQLAQAQETGAGVNERQHRQMHRIQEGAASGDLTRGETRRLVDEQRAIRCESGFPRRGQMRPHRNHKTALKRKARYVKAKMSSLRCKAWRFPLRRRVSALPRSARAQ